MNGNCTAKIEDSCARTNGDISPSCNGDETDHLAADWDRTVAGVKEQAFARLQEELSKAHQELRLRDEEVNRLSRIREEVEAELEELTASLFQVCTITRRSLVCNRYCSELILNTDILPVRKVTTLFYFFAKTLWISMKRTLMK